MNKLLYHGALLAGAAAIVWIGAGYAAGHALALGVTLLIAATYAAGAVELHRLRAATATLAAALATPPAEALAPWLERLHPTLRLPVQRRLEGERSGLPAPALTPYLVGLLVLLGMVGTFLGMVVTLQGTVSALESTADLQAMRAALAAPVRGLGLAFGTSAAGVCASAMLGLMSALARRERLQVLAALDAQIATTLARFTRAHRQDAGWRDLQAQAQQMPLLVEKVQALMERLAEQDQAAKTALVQSQQAFQRETQERVGALAGTVERSLRDSLAESARLTQATLQPAVERTLAGLAEQASALQAQAAQALQQHGDATAQALQAAVARVEAGAAERSAALVGDLSARFGEQAGTLVQAITRQQAEQQSALATREAERLAAWTGTLQQAAAEIRQASQSHAEATIAEVARLMHTAAEAPRVAAQVIGEMREQLSASVAHDNALLDERRQLMARFAALLQTVEAGSTRTSETLAALQQRFEARIDEGAAVLEAAAAQQTAGAVEVASLADAFGQAVLRYGEANDRLVDHLQRVEAALEQAAARSDEQLAYVVAQAREVIELSLLSQKQILDQMQQLGRRAPALADETP